MAMPSTSSSLQPVWSGGYEYEVARKEDDDPFSFSKDLPSLEFDGKGQSPLDWNYYLPFEQETIHWELSPPNPISYNNSNSTSAICVDPLWSIQDCKINCPSSTPDLTQEGIGDAHSYCLTGSVPFEEMGPIERPSEHNCHYGVAANQGDSEEAVVEVLCDAGRMRLWREARGGVESQTSKGLSKKAISQYFYLPITQAAKELNVGLTLLKKRCRELGIRRWPHRKLMSLHTLIRNVQEMGGASGRCAGKKNVVIEILKQERRLLEEVPDVQLEEKTKRLRQACFKANYKKRKLLRAAAADNGPYSAPSSFAPSSDEVFGYDTVFSYDMVGLGE